MVDRQRQTAENPERGQNIMCLEVFFAKHVAHWSRPYVFELSLYFSGVK
jgi:hypothetical protein